MENLEFEIWETVEEASDYEVSNLSRIRRKQDHKIIEPYYPMVRLKDNDGKKVLKLIHKVVAEKFLKKPSNFEEVDYFVNHKDGVRTNFKLSNLEWTTRSENMIHAYKSGLVKLRIPKSPDSTETVATNGMEKSVIGRNIITGEIKEWSGTREFGRQTGYSSTSASAACLKKVNRVGNWQLVFKKDYEEGIFDTLPIVEKYNQKAVLQIDLETNEVVKEFKSAREAEEHTGANFTKICAVCKGKRKTAGGFSWKYKN